MNDEQHSSPGVPLRSLRNSIAVSHDSVYLNVTKIILLKANIARDKCNCQRKLVFLKALSKRNNRWHLIKKIWRFISLQTFLISFLCKVATTKEIFVILNFLYHVLLFKYCLVSFTILRIFEIKSLFFFHLHWQRKCLIIWKLVK